MSIGRELCTTIAEDFPFETILPISSDPLTPFTITTALEAIELADYYVVGLFKDWNSGMSQWDAYICIPI
jgi:hypothetical protein